MTTNKTELAVAALKNGTVIDHIPARAVFKAARILGLENLEGSVTIGYNLNSRKLGKKGIIKVADVEFDEATLNRIALIAPSAVINIIRDYEVAEKRNVKLPDTLTGIVKCPNPKCVSNNEPMRTVFRVTDDISVLRCHYCNHTVKAEDAKLL